MKPCIVPKSNNEYRRIFPILKTVLILCVLMTYSGLKPACADESKPMKTEKDFLIGGDISALTKIEEYGGVFRDQGQAKDAITIMRANGFNCFRLRLFVNPTGRGMVVNDLDYTIALAKRIKATGAKLLLDFHYSDTWADPGKQFKPKAWEKLSFPELQEKVFTYTRDSLQSMCAVGVPPDFVQPGNEISPGMLWPDGKLYSSDNTDKQWEKFTLLLKAAIRGIKVGMSGTDCARIVIHTDKGANWNSAKHFFENIEKHNVPYDIIGLSFYPWWHGTMDQARETISNAAKTFQKDVFIVETGYPYRNMKLDSRHKPENMTYPQTPNGQKMFLKDLVDTVRSLPQKRGIGVLWWYPESIPLKDRRVYHGGATALFDQDGNALPAITAFRKSKPDQ